jgi:hypothetical protein
VIYILAASILAGVSWVQLQAELPSRSELGVAAILQGRFGLIADTGDFSIQIFITSKAVVT